MQKKMTEIWDEKAWSSNFWNFQGWIFFASHEVTYVYFTCYIYFTYYTRYTCGTCYTYYIESMYLTYDTVILIVLTYYIYLLYLLYILIIPTILIVLIILLLLHTNLTYNLQHVGSPFCSKTLHPTPEKKKNNPHLWHGWEWRAHSWDKHVPIGCYLGYLEENIPWYCGKNHGDRFRPVRIGLWDLFQMTELHGFSSGGDPNHLLTGMIF